MRVAQSQVTFEQAAQVAVVRLDGAFFLRTGLGDQDRLE